MKQENLQNIYLFYVLLLAFIGLPFYGNATHIVGGELNYKCLGNDEYEISLTVFRDCYNGNPNAYFDDPASIGIFDINNQLINSLGEDGQLLIDLIEDDTLEPVLFDSCLVVPPDVCVHTTTYIDTLNLPFRTGGYQLAYQRCCRNQTIVNIVAPLATGATYYNYISEEALLGCNSSAVFNQWPPNYICVDEPIRFDHSATDIDGDSIVYRMCTPFLGANQDTPRPQPPFNPPYDSITWIDPPYNVANMMGGVPLEIDPNTGLLTGTPNTIGQFVVGVCVEEYRDGILISTTKRDFQYNTGICGEAISSFFAPEVDCDGFSVDFTNQSDNATEFYWNFGDPNTTSDVSILSNPSYVYPDTGLYEIMLIADPNDLCSDTTYTTVSVQYPSLFVDFDMEIIDGCIFPAEIIFTDITYDTISTPVEWEWLFSDGTVSNEQNPVWIITDGGNYTATLTVTSENGCQFSTVEALTVEVLNLNLTDTTVICQGEEVQLNVNSDLLYTYTWTPDSNIDDVNIPSPTVSPTSTTTYYVNVFDPSTGCDYTDSVTVIIPPDIILETREDTISCEAEIPLYVNGNVELDYQWYEDAALNLSVQSGGEIEVIPGYESSYYVVATDTFGCSQMDSVTVGSRMVEAEAIPVTICFEDNFEANILNLNSNAPLIYEWLPDDIIQSGQGTNQIMGYTEESVTLEVALENQFGCVDTLDIDVTVIEELEITLRDTIICSREEVQLNVNPNLSYNYTWTPDININDNNLPNPTVSPTSSTTYYVDVLDPNTGCTTNDSIRVELFPAIVFETNEDTISCGAGSSISLYVNGNVGLDYQWYEDLDFSNPIQIGGDISLISEGETMYYVMATDAFGCSQTDSVMVENKMIEAILNPVIVCFEDGFEMTVQNLNPNDPLTYIWSPNNVIQEGQGTNQIIGYTEESVVMEVALENDFGCVDTLEADITVIEELEEIPIEATPDSIYPGDSTILIPNGNPNYQYEWLPEESLDNPTLFSPTASPLEETTYNVTITDENGCFTLSEVTVYMKTFECEEPYLFVPNAFTPNGDNTNDIFYVRGNAVQEVSMIIYNRWGEKVFETESLEEGWDGTYNGKELPPDVYGYYLRILCVGEEEFIKKGNVTLIR